MTSIQATALRPGTRIRRKQPSDDATIYLVERVEPRTHRYKSDVVIHAGGQAFKAWEIERADLRQGWPRVRGTP